LFFNVSPQLQFMLTGLANLFKKPSESWHKAVKNMSNHHKLSEWQKFASRFTEIVHKSSSSEDSRKCRRRFKRFVDLFDSLEQRRTSNWIFKITDVGSRKQCLGLLTLLALMCSGNLYTIKHKRILLSGWTVRWWTCVRTQFCLFKQHWCRN